MIREKRMKIKSQLLWIIPILWSMSSLYAQDLESSEPTNKSKEVKQEDGASKSSTEGSASDSHDTEGMDRIEREKYEPRISNKWFRGSYLIYDCTRGNFVCVNYQGFVRCGDEREEDKKKSRPALRCAAFKKFKTQESCFKEQYRQIENQKPRVFCMNPKYY